MKLIDVSIGQKVCVERIDEKYCFFRRLVELGFVKGVEITPLFSSLVKGSKTYNVCDTVVALRDTIAENIDVTLIKGGRYEE